jgi:hypothetical protein
MAEKEPKIVGLIPEKILTVLRGMPGVISAEYRSGNFFAKTAEGTAKIKFLFPQVSLKEREELN